MCSAFQWVQSTLDMPFHGFSCSLLLKQKEFHKQIASHTGGCLLSLQLNYSGLVPWSCRQSNTSQCSYTNTVPLSALCIFLQHPAALPLICLGLGLSCPGQHGANMHFFLLPCTHMVSQEGALISNPNYTKNPAHTCTTSVPVISITWPRLPFNPVTGPWTVTLFNVLFYWFFLLCFKCSA